MNTPPKLLIASGILILSTCLQHASAQENWEHYVSFNGSNGRTFNKTLADYGSTGWEQIGGKAGQFGIGYQLRKNQWAGELGLGYYRVLNQFWTRVDDSYGVGTVRVGNGYTYTQLSYLFNIRGSVTRFYPTPLPNVAENWYLKGSMGYYFGPNQTVGGEIYNVSAQSNIMPRGSVSFNPEVGIRFGRKRLQLELALEGHYHSQALVETSLASKQQVWTLDQGTHDIEVVETRSDRSNHWGLKAAVYWKLQRQKKEEFIPPPERYEEREVEITETIEVSHGVVELAIWDHGGYDMDTISLGLNGIYLVRSHELKERKYKMDLSVAEGENILLMYAHNLGKYPPNTATLLITDGDKEYKVQLDSNLKTSQAIKIIYKPGEDE